MIELDHLESLWPPYRGSVLLGAARESQGRISNARVSSTAGHIALSLEVHPADADEGRGSTPPGHAVAEGQEFSPLDCARLSAYSPPASCLTVLLDAVPDNAAKPGTHQMARFLTKVLEQQQQQQQQQEVSEESRGGAGRVTGYSAQSGNDDIFYGGALPAHEESTLGEDIPEMLVVEHLNEVRTLKIKRKKSGTRQSLLRC